MNKRRRGRRGFSLVELVVVMVIIGIIAAIAIPRMSRAASGAGESALIGNLSVLRNAIELYASEHNGVYPGKSTDGAGGAAETAKAFTTQLTKSSNAAGAVVDVKDSDHLLGPYLRKGIPPAPVGVNKGSGDVLIDKTNSPPVVNTAGGEGWVYNTGTGDMIVNSGDNNGAGNKAFNDY